MRYQKLPHLIGKVACGSRKAKVFLESHDDWDPDSPITVKYNSRAAALYKDKVVILCSILWENVGLNLVQFCDNVFNWVR